MVNADNVAEYWNFMREEYLSCVLNDGKLYFQNVDPRCEQNVIAVDKRKYSARSVGYFSLATGSECLYAHHFWSKYADWGKGVAVGFRLHLRQDNGPIVAGDLSVAMSKVRKATPLYIPSKDSNGVPCRCYYTQVFYNLPDEDSPGGLTDLSEADLSGFSDVSFTVKPSLDRPDKETRLIVFDCDGHRDVFHTGQHLPIQLRAVVLGPQMGRNSKARIQSNHPTHVRILEIRPGKCGCLEITESF